MNENPFPYGFVAKIQPSHHVDQRIFGHNVNNSEFTVCKFWRSTWFVNHPREEFLSPDQKLLITTFEQDERLLGRTPEDEVKRYEKLEGIANGAFPGDRFTYEDMSRREILREIEESVQRQLATKRLMDDKNVNLPLYAIIPGWKDWHYEHCHSLISELGGSVGFDATQYRSKYRLKSHLETLENVLNPDRIFVNGRVAPSYLHEFPRTVCGFSGKMGILEEIKDEDGIPQRKNLSESVDKRLKEATVYQSKMTEFYGGDQ